MRGDVLRAGLVGLGSMGRNHVRVLTSTEGIALVGIADPAGDQTGVAGTVPVVRDVEALLALGIDLCVVAAPTDRHHEVGLALAGAGVHALIEKPLAVDVEQASEIVDAFDRAGLIAAVGHIERFNPSLVAMKARLDAGQLGEVYQIATSRQGPFPERITDVGVVMDLATHDVDLTAWIGGAPFRSISAYTVGKAGRRHEDLLAASGALANGVLTNHQVNWLNPAKERQVTVLGEEGKLVADTLTADLTFYANGTQRLEWDALHNFRGVSEGDVTRYALRKVEPLRAEHEAFRDAVLGRAACTVSAAEGLQAVTVARCILQSAARHQLTATALAA